MAASRNSRSPDLPRRIADRLARLLAAADPHSVLPASPLSTTPVLAVGLSGGRDSVALLAALAAQAPARGWRLQAVHVHHGLSPHADAWAAFCGDLCARLGVPLQVHRVSLPEARPAGLEATARAARYQVFAGLTADALILAHHRDDQAETLLFNLLRGSGLRGLAAMPGRRLLPRPGHGPLPLLRPLLETSRAELETWLAAEGLGWIEDESNGDRAYARNFLRHEALPLLQSRFPAAVSLGRAAALAGEAEDLLEELAAQDLAKAAVGSRLQQAALAGLSSARGRNLLRCWLRRHGAPMPEARALAELWQQLACPRPDGQVEWRCSEWAVRLWRGTVFLDHEPLQPPSSLAEPAGPFVMPVPWAFGSIGGREVIGQGVALALCGEAARFRLRQGGETMQLPGRPRRPLKKLLQEADIPPWQRQRLPLLWVGQTLAWVPGIGIAADCLARADAPGWLPEWRPAESASLSLSPLPRDDPDAPY